VLLLNECLLLISLRLSPETFGYTLLDKHDLYICCHSIMSSVVYRNFMAFFPEKLCEKLTLNFYFVPAVDVGVYLSLSLSLSLYGKCIRKAVKRELCVCVSS
jgi:hypothetical protein